MKEINIFIEKYNEYLELKKKKFTDVVLIKKKENISQKEPILYFLENFIFPQEYNYSGFCFYDDENYDLQKHLIHFASHIDYNLIYVFDKKNGKIMLLDEESFAVEWYCSDSINTFFESMSIVMETKILMIKTNNWDLDENYLKQKYQECMSLNQNKRKFKKFYKHIIGLD